MKKTSERTKPTAKPKAAAKRAVVGKGSSSAAKPLKVQVSSEQLPRKNLEQALRIARALRDQHAGGPVGWTELAKAAGLGLSQANKYYLWAAQAYGLIDKEGDNFLISETARKILAPTRVGEEREAMTKAILTPTTLSRFFTDYDGNIFPSDQHLGNILEVRYQIPRDRLEEAGLLIKENGQFAGILTPNSDGKLMVRLDPSQSAKKSFPIEINGTAAAEESPLQADVPAGDYSNMCFVITPIGDDDSPERKHADMILRNVIEPITSELGFAAVRADQIDRSGIITKQIYEHIARARLCIADLSFNNPNVFYELGIRHTCKLPTVQIIRKGDRIPFDVSQGRTIKIDMTDVYSVVESIESAKRELRQHLKHVISGDYKGEDNPVNVYLPGLIVQVPR